MKIIYTYHLFIFLHVHFLLHLLFVELLDFLLLFFILFIGFDRLIFIKPIFLLHMIWLHSHFFKMMLYLSILFLFKVYFKLLKFTFDFFLSVLWNLFNNSQTLISFLNLTIVLTLWSSSSSMWLSTLMVRASWRKCQTSICINALIFTSSISHSSLYSWSSLMW